MANITTLSVGTLTHPTAMDNGHTYVVDNVIDFAEVLTAKGSALAAADTIECIVLPIGTFVLFAGLEVVQVDDSTTLTLDLGQTGGTVDQWVDGFDMAAAAVGDYGAYDANIAIAAQFDGATADTLDLVFATQSGTTTVGKVRVFAVIADCSGGSRRTPGIAQIGS